MEAIDSSTQETLQENFKQLLCTNCKCSLDVSKTQAESSTQTSIHTDTSAEHISCNKPLYVLPDSTSSNVQVSTISSCEKRHSKKHNSSSTISTHNLDADVLPKIRSIKKVFKNSKQHPPNPDSLPPCRVCGEKASGLHYGVNTCEPCKVNQINSVKTV